MISFLKNALTRLGVLNQDEQISITNITVMLFVAITAFKTLFGGLLLKNDLISWKIESVDISATLPLLFSLLNYSHKRSEINKNKKEDK